MSRKILGGNWKMHKTIQETEKYFKEFLALLDSVKTDYEIVIFPPFTALKRAVELTKKSVVKIGAQNMHYEESGAFTGEISPIMLKEIGVEYVLIGHSERRKYFAETETLLAKKILSGIAHGFNVMYCVGETLEEREKGLEFNVVERQLREGLKEVEKSNIKQLSIAYEPVWAIGTGKTATPQQAQVMHEFIKKILKEMFGDNDIPVLYGGSVKPHNVEELTSQKDIDGALVGGASLRPDSFIEIIKNSR